MSLGFRVEVIGYSGGYNSSPKEEFVFESHKYICREFLLTAYRSEVANTRERRLLPYGVNVVIDKRNRTPAQIRRLGEFFELSFRFSRDKKISSEIDEDGNFIIKFRGFFPCEYIISYSILMVKYYRYMRDGDTLRQSVRLALSIGKSRFAPKYKILLAIYAHHIIACDIQSMNKYAQIKANGPFNSIIANPGSYRGAMIWALANNEVFDLVDNLEVTAKNMSMFPIELTLKGLLELERTKRNRATAEVIDDNTTW